MSAYAEQDVDTGPTFNLWLIDRPLLLMSTPVSAQSRASYLAAEQTEVVKAKHNLFSIRPGEDGNIQAV